MTYTVDDSAMTRIVLTYAIEALHLEAGAYRPAGRLEGATATALPPFSDLRLDPTEIWP